MKIQFDPYKGVKQQAKLLIDPSDGEVILVPELAPSIKPQNEPQTSTPMVFVLVLKKVNAQLQRRPRILFSELTSSWLTAYPTTEA